MFGAHSTLSKCWDSQSSLPRHRFLISRKPLLTEGAVPGQETVSGAAWLELSYGYSINHLWRNFGIIIAFFIFFTVVFLIAVEFKAPPQTRGEVLVFPMGKEPKHLLEESSNAKAADVESGRKEPNRASEGVAMRTTTSSGVEAMKKDLQAPQDIFTWRNVCCDVHIKSETRRLLSNVSGYVKPGTLTALMGESGAGKTTLLDTYTSSSCYLTSRLAQRNETGIITGEMLVNGKPLPPIFQRSCGYVQQQDVSHATIILILGPHGRKYC